MGRCSSISQNRKYSAEEEEVRCLEWPAANPQDAVYYTLTDHEKLEAGLNRKVSWPLTPSALEYFSIAASSLRTMDLHSLHRATLSLREKSQLEGFLSSRLCSVWFCSWQSEQPNNHEKKNSICVEIVSSVSKFFGHMQIVMWMGSWTEAYCWLRYSYSPWSSSTSSALLSGPGLTRTGNRGFIRKVKMWKQQHTVTHTHTHWSTHHFQDEDQRGWTRYRIFAQQMFLSVYLQSGRHRFSQLPHRLFCDMTHITDILVLNSSI